MSLRYGYFDSEITGYDEEGMPIFDRAESSDFFALFISNLVSDGVLASPGDCFQVIAYEGMTLKVRPGFGIIRGRLAYDSQDYTIELSKAPTSYKRIDRVVLRANYLNRLCEVVVKEGTPDANPVAPELLQPASGDYYELSLATVAINSNQVIITQSNITDTRADSTQCGFVTQLIDHLDTDVFYAQLDAFYAEFVEKSNKSYEQFVSEVDEYFSNIKIQAQNDLDKIVADLTDFEKRSESEFNTWFENIRGKLSDDPAGKLQNEIDSLTQRVFEHYYGLDSQNTVFKEDGSIVQTNNEAVVTTVKGYDSDGNKVITQTVAPILGSEYYVKTTTFYPKTETSEKRIVESYTTMYRTTE